MNVDLVYKYVRMRLKLACILFQVISLQFECGVKNANVNCKNVIMAY